MVHSDRAKHTYLSNIQNFMRLFDIEIPTKTGKGTLVVDLKESISESVENMQRTDLFYNWRTNIQAFQDILNIDFDMDTTFEKECYLKDNYLCTVAHNADDKVTGLVYPGTKDYNLVVTWPDGRKEDWTLSFYIWEEGEKKGQFKEVPKGRKFESQFIFTGIIH